MFSGETVLFHQIAFPFCLTFQSTAMVDVSFLNGSPLLFSSAELISLLLALQNSTVPPGYLLRDNHS